MQRVSHCKVLIEEEEISTLSFGLLVLLGIKEGDKPESVRWLAEKIVNLRIFEDGDCKMNLSVLDKAGQIMVVSQFTLYGDTHKGRRPEFTQAMKPSEAEVHYEAFVQELRNHGVTVQTGRFGAKMDVALVNHGPVTLLLEHP